MELPSETAVPIGMAIHELTTNAAKYGALSVRTGQVSVILDRAGEDENGGSSSLAERGGPASPLPHARASAPACCTGF